jgi:hypothetical protein
MNAPLRIFIGYDSLEPIAYHVCAHSILTRASQPIAIYPLSLRHLRRVYWRERGALEATEFSMSRFLVPYLCDYKGFAIFMDCDMLVRDDILAVVNYQGPTLAGLDPVGDPDATPLTRDQIAMIRQIPHSKAVWCCQHDYIPKHFTKMDGVRQTTYPRKNWSSFMIFNNERCTALTPEHVNKATGMMLHRFWWTEDDQIGALPLEWNWLVGEYEKNPDAKILHYTNGGPWFPNQRDCDHADLWLAELDAMLGETVLV